MRYEAGVVNGDGEPTTGYVLDVRGATFLNGLGFNRTAVANANYTVLLTDVLVVLSSLATSNKTVTLPSAAVAGNGRVYIFKNETNSGLSMLIARAGSDLINLSSASLVLGNQATVMLYCTGTGWFTI